MLGEVRLMGAMEVPSVLLGETLLDGKVSLPIDGNGPPERSRWVYDSDKASERVSVPLVWTCATHFSFSHVFAMLCVSCERQRRVQFEGCVAEPLQTTTASLFGSKWSWLPLRVLLPDACD